MKNLKVKLISFLLLTLVMVSCGSDEPIAITPPLNEVLENLNNYLRHEAIDRSIYR